MWKTLMGLPFTAASVSWKPNLLIIKSANAPLMDCNDSKGICVARKINNTLFKGFWTLTMFWKMQFVRNEREIRRKAVSWSRRKIHKQLIVIKHAGWGDILVNSILGKCYEIIRVRKGSRADPTSRSQSCRAQFALKTFVSFLAKSW